MFNVTTASTLGLRFLELGTQLEASWATPTNFAQDRGFRNCYRGGNTDMCRFVLDTEFTEDTGEFKANASG